MTVFSTDTFSAAEYEKMYGLMSPARREKADRYIRSSDRKLCILSDFAVRKLISEMRGLPPGKIEILTDENGKPFTPLEGVFFNYSHSGNFAAAEVSDRPVGVDIEALRELKAADKAALRRFATDAEAEYIGDDAERFFTIWTLKEAYLKCTGEGINNNLKAAEFKITDGEVLCSVPGYSFRVFYGGDYIASVCYANGKTEI